MWLYLSFGGLRTKKKGNFQLDKSSQKSHIQLQFQVSPLKYPSKSVGLQINFSKWEIKILS